ncbi:MAG TPA: hypothetical protein VF017_14300 [Thermoanaerobaculia bacterium]|nr:hypothetical protein [Thermoanaerobaculia bacterium]
METPISTPPPPPQAPPTKKGLPVVAWILIGCLGLVVLGGIGFVTVTYIIGKKVTSFVKEAADKPLQAAARAYAFINPDLELVSVDEEADKVTFKNVKTGETVTLDGSDIREGRLTMDTGKGKVTIDAKGSGQEGKVEVTDAAGKTVFEAGAADLSQLPAWVPRYPGASSTGMMATGGGADGRGGVFQLKTGDSVDEVRAYYERELEGAGFDLQKNSVSSGGSQFVTLIGTGREGRSVTVGILRDGGETQVTLQYGER